MSFSWNEWEKPRNTLFITLDDQGGNRIGLHPESSWVRETRRFWVLLYSHWTSAWGWLRSWPHGVAEGQAAVKILKQLNHVPSQFPTVSPPHVKRIKPTSFFNLTQKVLMWSPDQSDQVVFYYVSRDESSLQLLTICSPLDTPNT